MTALRLAPLGLLLSLLLPLPAAAQESREVIAASYSAPRDCGSREVLTRRFEERVPERRLLFRSDAPVQITITNSAAGARARLRILLEEGGELSRTIEADDCNAAIEAIAFIAAVALDPGADEPLQIRQEEVVLEEEPANEPSAPPSPRERVPRFWTIGLQGRANQGVAPDFIWGGGVSLENASGRGGMWAPSARLALGYSVRGGFEEELGTAQFELAKASLDLCPSQAIGEIFRIQLCATVEGGVVRAEGTETFAPESSARPWVGVGPASFAEVMIAGPVGLSYRAAGIFPFIRDSYQFETAVFHEVPPMVLELNAGISVHF